MYQFIAGNHAYLEYCCQRGGACASCAYHRTSLCQHPTIDLRFRMESMHIEFAPAMFCRACACVPPHDVFCATHAGSMARTHGKRCGHGRGQLPARLAVVLQTAHRNPRLQCPHQRLQRIFPKCQSLRSHQLKQQTVLQHNFMAISTARTPHATFRWLREPCCCAAKSLFAHQAASMKQVCRTTHCCYLSLSLRRL